MSAVPTPQSKRTRHERKVARNAMLASVATERAQFERLHPVLSGRVPVVDYKPPYGVYQP